MTANARWTIRPRRQSVLAALPGADHPPGASAQEILRRSREPLSAESLSRLSQRAGVELNWVKALADGSHVLVPEDAAVAEDGCSNIELAPGASCDVTVTITPHSSGELSLSLSANTAGDGDVPFVVSISARVAEPSSALSSEGDADGDASTETSGSSGSGGGGCSVLRSGGLPDATLALLALLALTAGAYRKRKPSHAGSQRLARQR